MQKLTALTASFLILGLTLLIPQEASAQHNGRNNRQHLKGHVDRNNNGVISRKERRQAVKRIQRLADRNNDGVITRRERQRVAQNTHGTYHRDRRRYVRNYNWQTPQNQAGGWHGALLNGQNPYNQAGGWHGALLNGTTAYPMGEAPGLYGTSVNNAYGQYGSFDVDGDGVLNKHEQMYAQLLMQQARKNK